MIAMSNPVLPAAAPAAAGSGQTAGAASDVAAQDFVLMLGQLLGAPVAQAATSTKATTGTATDATDADQAAQDAAAVTGVPLPFIALPQNPQAAGAEAAKSTELLSIKPGTDGIKAGAGASAADIAAALMDSLSKDDGGNTTPVAQQAPAVEVPQTLRPVVTADPATMRTVHHQVGSSAWADEVGTRMIMMSERGQHSASLRLTPEHLGPLEVRISVRDDQASVWFGSAHADTRAAIEQALPRLRELFASQGMSLTDAGVHHQPPREQGRTPGSFSASGAGGATESEAIAPAEAIRLGLVDAYA